MRYGQLRLQDVWSGRGGKEKGVGQEEGKKERGIGLREHGVRDEAVGVTEEGLKQLQRDGERDSV